MAVNVSGGELHAGPVNAPVFPLLLIGIGGYLAWFGIHYWRSDTRWPTDPVKAALQGKSLPATAQVTSYETQVSSAAAGSSATSGAPSGGYSVATNVPAAKGSYDTAGLEKLWKDNGGPADTAAFAAQVAMAESSGNPKATSRNPDGGTNVGLWQLDTPGGVGAGYSVAELQDPNLNCQVTIMATNGGTNWSEWGDPVTAAVGYHYTPQLS